MSKIDYSMLYSLRITEELASMSPKEYRRIAREGGWKDTHYTFGVCRGYVQADLAIIPKEYAFHFLLFCHLNPRPFPVLDVTEPGDPRPLRVAPEADLRTDLVKYRVFQNGRLIDEPHDILKYWRDDLVGFVLGCSISFDWALQAANIPYRKFGDYTTNIQLVPAGPFRGRMCVGTRLFKGGHDVTRAVQITSRHLLAHGPPVHYCNPEAIGIKDMMKPDVWTPEKWPIDPPQPNETIVFWATGAGLPEVARASKIPLMITHFSGPMFITDKLHEELAIL